MQCRFKNLLLGQFNFRNADLNIAIAEYEKVLFYNQFSLLFNAFLIEFSSPIESIH